MNIDLDKCLKVLDETTYDICERWHLNKKKGLEDSAPSFADLTDDEKLNLIACLFISDEDRDADADDEREKEISMTKILVLSLKKSIAVAVNTSQFIEMTGRYIYQADKTLEKAWNDYCDDEFVDLDNYYLSDMDNKERALDIKQAMSKF